MLPAKTKTFSHLLIYYADLNNDSVSEKIVFDTTFSDRVGLRIYQKDRLINQWNFDGKLIPTNTPFWGDLNGDGLKELFVFTYHDNEIFLNCLTPFKNNILVKDRTVAQHSPVDRRDDCIINPCGFFDPNKDGIKKFYFIANSGFSLKPRKMFAYDLANDTLYSSPESCAAIVNKAVSHIGNKLNFLIATDAAGNFTEKDPYSDSTAWLMDFNENLNFKFDPIKIGFHPSYSDVIPLDNNNENNFVVMNIYSGTKNYSSTITLYDSKLDNIIQKRFAYNDRDWSNSRLYYDN